MLKSNSTENNSNWAGDVKCSKSMKTHEDLLRNFGVCIRLT